MNDEKSGDGYLHPAAAADGVRSPAGLQGLRQARALLLGSGVGAPILKKFSFVGKKTYSAIVRVKNEEEFLDAAVRSIIPCVDEVVIVDNLSTDQTPKVIEHLVKTNAGRVRAYTYPFSVARYGEENAELASTRRGRRSPALLANFYNWTTSLCRSPFVLKWDGDTIATPHAERVLEDFRTSPAMMLWHTGANLHENRTSLIAAHPYEDYEPRLFFRSLSNYDNGLQYCERLESPYIRRGGIYNETCDRPIYVHMKYCKSDRFSNMSPDLQEVAKARTLPGIALSDDVRATIDRWALSV